MVSFVTFRSITYLEHIFGYVVIGNLICSLFQVAILLPQHHLLKHSSWASLAAQWLRICLPMQGTRVRALVWEDPTCHGATKPATTTEPARLKPVLRNKRGRDSERPAHRDEEWPPLAATRESPCTETKTQHSQK